MEFNVLERARDRLLAFILATGEFGKPLDDSIDGFVTSFYGIHSLGNFILDSGFEICASSLLEIGKISYTGGIEFYKALAAHPKFDTIDDMRAFINEYTYEKPAPVGVGVEATVEDTPVDNNKQADIVKVVDTGLKCVLKRSVGGQPIEVYSTIYPDTGAVIIYKGQQLAKPNKLTEYARKIRAVYREYLTTDCVTTTDLKVKSLSRASSLVIGNNTNGWLEWKTLDGEYLNDLKSGNTDLMERIDMQDEPDLWEEIPDTEEPDDTAVEPEVEVTPYTLDDFNSEVLGLNGLKLLDLATKSLNILFKGVPGTGKTVAAYALAQLICGEKNSSRIYRTQFNSNYNYTNFMCYQTFSANGDYNVVPGILMQIADVAKLNPDKKYVLIIDELTRGNVAAIFGESLTYIEKKHRDEEFITMFNTTGLIPPNIYIICTANDCDISVKRVDKAILERFKIVSIKPIWGNTEVINSVNLTATQLEVVNKIKELNDSLETPNDTLGNRILFSLLAGDTVESIVNNNIIDALETLFEDDEDELEHWTKEFSSIVKDGEGIE